MLLLAHRTPPDAQRCADLHAAGAGGFEVDVQLRGGDVVVSHYLPFLRVRGWWQHDGAQFRWRHGTTPDPLLATVLAQLPPGVTVLLDPKETGTRRRARLAAAVARLVPDLPVPRARLRVSTDDTADLRRYRDAGLATWRTVKDDGALARLLADGAGGDAGVSVRHMLLTPATVADLHAVVGDVVAWTVNDVARAQALRAAGVDGVTTDSVDVLRALR